MKIAMKPIAYVRTSRDDLSDDDWGDVSSTIELVEDLSAETVVGLEEFSHVEVFFIFDRVAEDSIVPTARHPRDNPSWPRVGIFAQRGKGRPNRLGATVCRMIGRDARRIHVVGLDAIDGTPVVDLKPVMREFLPREPVVQPAWATELMRDYWQRQGASPDPGSTGR
jgi:tRNA-Thr(GGU) m(6)t(6)A37 methyltransferase TsaA